jgi:CBS domain-containing protein
MKARDVMTQPVISIDADAPIALAVRLMLQKTISGLPVIDAAGNLVGVVTEGDFLRRAEAGTQQTQPRWLEFVMGAGALADQYVKAHGRKIAEVMTRDVKTATEDTPLPEVIDLMERHRVKRIPILRGKKLIGIVTRANLLRALASVMLEPPAASADDAVIRKRIIDALRAESWAPAATVDALVREGEVTLTGYLLDERQRAGLKVLVENVPGVKNVRDKLIWVEPMSGMTIEPDEGAEGKPQG